MQQFKINDLLGCFHNLMVDDISIKLDIVPIDFIDKINNKVYKHIIDDINKLTDAELIDEVRYEMHDVLVELG